MPYDVEVGAPAQLYRASVKLALFGLLAAQHLTTLGPRPRARDGIDPARASTSLLPCDYDAVPWRVAVEPLLKRFYSPQVGAGVIREHRVLVDIGPVA